MKYFVLSVLILLTSAPGQAATLHLDGYLTAYNKQPSGCTIGSIPPGPQCQQEMLKGTLRKLTRCGRREPRGVQNPITTLLAVCAFAGR